MEYRIIEEGDSYKLEKHVNRLIAQGWIPQGGACVSIYMSDYIYIQAMVKKSK